MKFENTGLEGLVIEYQALEDIMESAGFHSAYDYERITFDYKMEVQDEEIYYLRVQGYAVEGEIPALHSKVKLLTVLLGKHYYPHGVEYDEVFPKNVVDRSNKKLKAIAEKVKAEAIA
ncbi:YugN family protein [Evansella clarkii]|jgi:hypothetical protein|uniref:YugN family protein n=1 Tax=Evansella clarkii TaxID=79879 RepID=UPI0009976FFA|nr:YugN family protein [Evansella clarkii]